MKKVKLIIALGLIVSIVLNACGRTPDEQVKETGSTESMIPADYATAIVVTINPKIKLYLDSENAIICAEFLNTYRNMHLL